MSREWVRTRLWAAEYAKETGAPIAVVPLGDGFVLRVKDSSPRTWTILDGSGGSAVAGGIWSEGDGRVWEVDSAVRDEFRGIGLYRKFIEAMASTFGAFESDDSLTEHAMRAWKSAGAEVVTRDGRSVFRVKAQQMRKNPSGPVIDSASGIGTTPNNDEVDYLGMRVLMRPSVFLRLALYLPSKEVREKSIPFLEKAMMEGRGIGPPTLYLDIPNGWRTGDFSESASVRGHEGRHRAKSALRVFGDEPFEMHIFPRGFENRHLTTEWIERIRSGLISENGEYVGGPLFEPMTMAKNGGSPELRRTSRIFDECFDVVEATFPDFGECELHHDERAAADNGTGSERQFGYCMDGDPLVIAFAAKIEGMPDEYIRGLMRHEFGHAIDFRYGKDLGRMLGRRLPDGVERRADVIAECVFGDPIEYGRLDIQCIGCGGRTPRPGRLAK